MTLYTPYGIVEILARNVAAKNTWNTVYAVAICLAESGGNTDAISPAGARGLWQFLPFHFGRLNSLTANNWRDPVVQAHSMFILSGGMQNWAQWTPAWADPAHANYNGFVPVPQPGSAAEGHIEVARQAVTTYFLHPPTGPSGPALTPAEQDEKAVNDRINGIRAYFKTVFPGQIANTVKYSLRADRIK